MKTNLFKLLLIAIIFSTLGVQAQKVSKKVYRNYPVSQIEKLTLDNKYGTITLSDSRNDSVVVDVTIWVKGENEKARNLLNKINVNVSKTGSTLAAETVFDSNFNSNLEFSIDYVVSIPASRDLVVSQKYGTVNMANLTGSGTFAIQYGELRAQKLLSPSLAMDIAYSAAHIAETNNLTIVLRYSKLFLAKGKDLKLDSRYSTVDSGDFANITADSKYDNFKFGTVASFTGNNMYTGTSIEKLLRSLMLVNGYGKVSVNKIDAGFESITIDNKYAGINLNIDPAASYQLEGTVRYGNIIHPDGKFTLRSTENTSYTVKGTIGNNNAPKSAIKISSSYGNVKLVP